MLLKQGFEFPLSLVSSIKTSVDVIFWCDCFVSWCRIPIVNNANIARSLEQIKLVALPFYKGKIGAERSD